MSRWADQCEFEHDTSRQKTDGTWVGQNLYLHGSSNQYTYEEVRHRSYCHFGACYMEPFIYLPWVLYPKPNCVQLMTKIPSEASLGWYNEVVSPGFTPSHVNPFV